MELKRIASFALGLMCILTNQFAVYSKADYTDSAPTSTVTFVSDDEIEICSEFIDDRTHPLSQIPIIGRILVMLGYSEKIKFVKPDENCKNLLSKELFPEDSPKAEDVRQGNLGVCYFLAALAAAADKESNLIKNNLVEDNMGNVTVKFFNPDNGEPYYVKVQKTVPDLPDELKFLKNDCLWVQMYLKAFVASGFAGEAGYLYHWGRKSYKSAEGAFTGYSIRMITGKETKAKHSLSIWWSNKNKLFNEIESTLSNLSCVTCTFSSDFNVKSGEKLFSGHEYSISKVYKDNENQKWIVVRNPWGNCGKDGDGTHGYSTLKFEDFCHNCSDMFFSLNEKIKARGFIQRYLELLVEICPPLDLFCHIF